MEEKNIDFQKLTSKDILEYVELLKNKANRCQKKINCFMEEGKDVEAFLEGMIRVNIENLIFICKKELIRRNVDFERINNI